MNPFNTTNESPPAPDGQFPVTMFVHGLPHACNAIPGRGSMRPLLNCLFTADCTTPGSSACAGRRLSTRTNAASPSTIFASTVVTAAIRKINALMMAPRVASAMQIHKLPDALRRRI